MEQLNANSNQTFIYTEQCKICGVTEAYAALARRLQDLGKSVQVKQISLFAGWAAEAEELGLPMPSVFDYDSRQAETVENLNKKSNEELREWLGLTE